MKLMMMMTLSEEVDEVSFDPTASGRLFSAVQNIIGRSDLSTSTTIKLACPKEEEEERQGGDHPGQEKVEPGGEAGERLMVMLVRCCWIKGISFLYAPNVILLKYLALQKGSPAR